MTPFFFGETNKQLYGVFHPVQNKIKRDSSVLLCNAFGQEYMRSHRAIRQLATLLTKQGYDVLRFDYSGTGDSALNLEQVTAVDWVSDINVAISELQDISSVTRIHVVGLRLGGLLAAAACENRDDIESLNLWDPVTSGLQYINELKHVLSDEKSFNENGELNSNYQDSTGAIHFNGFALHTEMQETLKQLNILNIDLSAIHQLRHIISHQRVDSQLFIETMKQQKNFMSTFINSPYDWNYVDKYGGILLPQPIIQEIVNCLI